MMNVPIKPDAMGVPLPPRRLYLGHEWSKAAANVLPGRSTRSPAGHRPGVRSATSFNPAGRTLRDLVITTRNLRLA
jgi:hypothetical protein